MKNRIFILSIGLMWHSASIANPLSSVWYVQPIEDFSTERSWFSGGEFVLKQRLTPNGAVELIEDAPKKLKAKLVVGDHLVLATAGSLKAFCEHNVHPEKLFSRKAQTCLVDQNNDGKFESYFRRFNQTKKGMLVLGGKWPKKLKPITPIGYKEITPDEFNGNYFVAIERRNFFNIYGKENFQIAFGSEASVDRITSSISISSNELPKEVTILGASLTAHEEKDGKMSISVQRAMPRQPFGVSVTTSYRFY